MPVYQYRARDKAGGLFTGEIEAGSFDAVAAQIDQLGYIPVQIDEKKADILAGAREYLDSILNGVSLDDQIIFTRQLSTLVAAGMPFITSFDALADQTENKRLKEIILQVRNDVESGSSISDAFAKHPAVFNELYVNMVRAGEVGGVLDEMLDRLARLSEHEAETRARISAATRYPIIVILALCAAIVVLMTFVVPKFAAMYANFQADLPLPTRMMIGGNHIFVNYWYLLLIGVILMAVGIKKYINSSGGRVRWDRFKLRMPVFGKIFLKSALSRYARVFAALNRSGLPILQTLEVTSKTVNNVIIEKVITGIRDNARQGRGLVQPMKASGIFPPVVVNMVAIGEETGQLDEMLTKVSEYYDRDVDYSLRNLSTSLEPLLLVLIGSVILFMALAIFMPWWNLINVMKGGG